MKVIVNGVEKEFKAGATLKDAVTGEIYSPGSVVSVHKSTEKLTVESDDFEVITSKGSFAIHLDDSDHAELWKSKIAEIKGSTARWVTQNIAAFGSFATSIKVDRAECRYHKYDCFFSLGGFDSVTTYMMVAREDHSWAYGAGAQKIGRVTRGRHVVDLIREGDEILSIGPVISETQTDNYDVTSDMKYKLSDGNKVDTYVKVKLDMGSPDSAEHLMIISQKGCINAADVCGSFVSTHDDTDVKLEDEVHAVREKGSIYVRSAGIGVGCVFIYKERRQLSDQHSHVGDVVSGRSIIDSIRSRDSVTVVTEPKRMMSVGMRLKDAKALMEASGIQVSLSGETDGDSVVVEQTPERTVDIINGGKVELLAIPKEDIYRISFDRKQEQDVHYFEKVTGLNHKSIGSLVVHFWFEGMTMVTFNGDEVRGKSLYPGTPFKKSKRGDIGLTNQACDHHGLLGIRMKDSKEYGPTGEEPFGTNIFGRFEGDFKRFEENLEEGKTIYFTELEL